MILRGGNDFPHTPSIQKAGSLRINSDSAGLLRYGMRAACFIELMNSGLMDDWT